MMADTGLKKTKGLSLIEILMAVFILSVGIIGALKLNMTSFFSSHKSLVLSKKVELATGVVEKISSVRYDEIEDTCSEASGSVFIGGDLYHISCSVSPVASNLFKVVIVNVSSTSGANYQLIYYRISK